MKEEFNVDSPKAVVFTIAACLISGLFNMSPIILLYKIDNITLRIDEIPLLMFLAFYLSSIVLFNLSLAKRIYSNIELSVKEIEKWSSCFGYGVLLIANVFVFSSFIKEKLSYKGKKFCLGPAIIGIIIIPVIIIVVVIVIVIVSTLKVKGKQISETLHLTLICVFTIFVSISPCRNFRLARKEKKCQIIPKYTIISAIVNYLLWTLWMTYLCYANFLLSEENDIARQASRRYFIYGIFDFFALLINLIWLFYYCYLNKTIKNNNDPINNNQIEPQPLCETDSDGFISIQTNSMK